MFEIRFLDHFETKIFISKVKTTLNEKDLKLANQTVHSGVAHCEGICKINVKK